MRLLGQAAAITAKDLRIELRGRYGLGSVLPFAATLLIAFGLSLGPGRSLLQQTAPGLLWLAVLFAAVLSCRQAYDAETEDAALEGLALAPIDRASIFLGKAAAVTLQLWLLEAAILLLVAVLFGLSLAAAPAVLVGAFGLGTIGLAAVGTLFGVVTTSARAREAVFPLLVLPLAVPVLLGGVKATQAATSGGRAGSWLLLLAAFDAVFLAVGTLVFGVLMDE